MSIIKVIGINRENVRLGRELIKFLKGYGFSVGMKVLVGIAGPELVQVAVNGNVSQPRAAGRKDNIQLMDNPRSKFKRGLLPGTLRGIGRGCDGKRVYHLFFRLAYYGYRFQVCPKRKI